MTDGIAPETPGQRLNDLLRGQSRLTVATAESCTGGDVARQITAVAGSSDYFPGGVVSYSNEAKTALLGVDPAIFATRGAVSEECARAMAEGARRAFGATAAVSTTGIAGPTGATTRKPVGLVYIAVATPDQTLCQEHHFPGNRADVIAAASSAALTMLLAAAGRMLSIET